QPGARRRRLGGRRDRDRAAAVDGVRPPPPAARRASADPPAHAEADRHERADRAVVEPLPRAHAPLRRHRPRGRRDIFYHVAGQTTLGRRSRRPSPGVVYHDVTERKWALKALDSGVRGLIAVNSRAGGHAGPKSAEQLMAELGDLDVPLVCAGGIGEAAEFVAALGMGYAGVQLGTRFIATSECTAHRDYKRAIVESGEDDIRLTERVTGVPRGGIRTPHVERRGTKAGPLARWQVGPP